MHDGMPYGRSQGQGHSREVDRQSPTGLIFICLFFFLIHYYDIIAIFCLLHYGYEDKLHFGYEDKRLAQN